MILRRDVNRDLTHDEVDSNFIEAKNLSQKAMDSVEAIGSGEGGKGYPTLADALAAGIPDNVIFQVDPGDPDEGIWRRDSSNPEGAVFLRDLGVTDQDFQEYKNDIDPRLWPEGKTLELIDRPDLDFIYAEVDEDLRIINIYYAGGSSDRGVVLDTTYDRPDIELAVVDGEYRIIYALRHIGGYTPSPSPDPQPDPVEGISIDESFDRPDIPFAVVDKNYYLIFPGQEFEKQPVETFEYVKKFWEPPVQDAISPDTDPMLQDYNLLIDAWDGIVADNPTNPELEPYIVKSSMGTTSTENRTVYKYRFAPPNPKHKILLIAGTHGHEKLYVKALHEFMSILASQWFTDPVLEWVRWNVDITAIPCLSPTSLENPEYGSRGIKDIADFPVSWTKSGTTVTITYDDVDFPDTDGRFTADSLFLGEGLAGKTGVTIIDSSDVEGLDNYAHRINTVVNGKTITVETEEGGASSGTATMSIWTDPNRNWGSYNDDVWVDFTPSPSILTSGDYNYHYENKGLIPISLKETQNLRDLVAGAGFDFIVDMHMPANRHYLSYHASTVTPEFRKAEGNIKKYAGQFNMTEFRMFSGSTRTTFPSVYFGGNKQAFFTIEWAGGSHTVGSKDMTDGFRWMVIVITELLRTKL